MSAGIYQSGQDDMNKSIISNEIMNNMMNVNNNFNFSSFNQNDLPRYVNEFIQKMNHPYICMIHVLPKFFSIFIYFLGPFLFRNEKSKEYDFIITFAITFFLVSLDFYLVKNITGRFLVRMIWWIDSGEDYSNNVIFHSLEDKSTNSNEKNVFWFSLYIYVFIWLVQTIQMFISFQVCWFLLCVLCFFLSYYNLYNFWKCSKEQPEIVTGVLNKINFNAILKKLVNNKTYY
ncbi:hypothetical protein PFMG_00065 [Plasmodium falciparum IGH-CR14]|uniref:Golgi apparatus membrane protein TVP23 homolog n=1 Tax=Plasmodium falciparum IGH-CR14 TaxID=580059 RepID=A0A0L1I3C0_PLAFA|nr:hypothetical protein PFMG_00065 [Plasmodium falciparum IGH-CR14]